MTAMLLQPVSLKILRQGEIVDWRFPALVFGQWCAHDAFGTSDPTAWQVTHVPSGTRVPIEDHAADRGRHVEWFRAIAIAEALHAAYPDSIASPSDGPPDLVSRIKAVIHAADIVAIQLVKDHTDYLK